MDISDPHVLRDIIERAKNGDRQAFSKLYTHFFTPLYRYIYFRVGNKQDAEDITQDSFIKAYTSFSRYSYSGTSPLAYFYTIARNTVIDFRRKKSILISETDEDEYAHTPDSNKNPEEQAIHNQDSEWIKQKISLLPEDQQDVIVLRFIDDLTTKEISNLLGKSEESIRQLQSRGLKSLRKYI